MDQVDSTYMLYMRPYSAFKQPLMTIADCVIRFYVRSIHAYECSCYGHLAGWSSRVMTVLYTVLTDLLL
jgi:hypothetical protein